MDKKSNIKQILLKDVNSCISVKFDLNIDENKFLDDVAKKISNDIKLLQFDGSNLSSKKFLELGRKIQQLCSIYNVIYLIQSRVDIAKILNSDGIVLNCNDVDLKYAIEIFGCEKLFGYQISNCENDLLGSINQFDFIVYTKNIKQGLNEFLSASNLKSIEILG